MQHFLYHSIGQYPARKPICPHHDRFAAVWGAANDAQWGWLLSKRRLHRPLARHPERARRQRTTAENDAGGPHATDSPAAGTAARGSGGRRLLPSNHFLLTKLQERLGFSWTPWVAGRSMGGGRGFHRPMGPDVALAILTWCPPPPRGGSTFAAGGAWAAEGGIVGVDITQGGAPAFDVMAPRRFHRFHQPEMDVGTPGAGIPCRAPADPGLRRNCAAGSASPIVQLGTGPLQLCPRYPR